MNSEWLLKTEQEREVPVQHQTQYWSKTPHMRLYIPTVLALCSSTSYICPLFFFVLLPFPLLLGVTGLVRNLHITDSLNTSISLAWCPSEMRDDPSGYILEICFEHAKEWTKCTKTPITSTLYIVGCLQERMKSFFRIRPVNDGVLENQQNLNKGFCAPGNNGYSMAKSH